MFSKRSHQNMTGGKKKKQMSWLGKNENSKDFSLKQARTVIERDRWGLCSFVWLSCIHSHVKYLGVVGHSLHEQVTVLILWLIAEEEGERKCAGVWGWGGEIYMVSRKQVTKIFKEISQSYCRGKVCSFNILELGYS